MGLFASKQKKEDPDKVVAIVTPYETQTPPLTQEILKTLWEIFEKEKDNESIISKETAMTAITELLINYSKKYDRDDLDELLESVGTISGGYNYGQFEVIVWKVSTKYKINRDTKLLDSMKPNNPETYNSLYHSYHVLKHVRNHSFDCNICGKTYNQACSFRCDICDYDVCVDCSASSNEKFEEEKKQALEKLKQVRDSLINLSKKNDLNAVFEISLGEPLTVKLLNSKFIVLSRGADKQMTETEENLFVMRNKLKTLYWTDISEDGANELLKIYEEYHKNHRPLYTHIEIAGGVLNDLFVDAKALKKKVTAILKEEKQEPQKHLLWQEMKTYIACLKVLLHFYNPLLGKSKNGMDSIMNMLIMKLLLDPDASPDIKRMCMYAILTGDIPGDLLFILLLSLQAMT